MGKIKQFIENEKGKDALIVVIVILVGLGSFELGRLSKESGSPGIEIEYTDAYTASPANVVSASESVNTMFILTGFFGGRRASHFLSVLLIVRATGLIGIASPVM